MTSRALRDLKPGDVVDDHGTPRTVTAVIPAFDDHGYPIVTVTYEDGGALVHNASHTVKA